MKLKDALWVLFISMVPIIELRGAVPVGAVLKLPFYINYIVAVVGNLIPVPFILFFIPKILDFLERFKLFRPIVQWLHKKADKNRGKIDKASVPEEASDISADSAESTEISDTPSEQTAIITPVAEEAAADAVSTKAAARTRMSIGTFIALMLFVLIPAPGTGAWTGALVASLFSFPRLKSFAAIAIGVVGCGVIMCLASYGVLGFLSFLL